MKDIKEYTEELYKRIDEKNESLRRGPRFTKAGKLITVFALVLSLTLVVVISATSADIVIKSPDNHYLNDAKNVNVYVLTEDENGRIRCELCNLYERETERRAQPLGEYFIEKLTEMGVGKEKANSMTVGEYEDYIYNLPIDDEHKAAAERCGVSPEEYADWTNMDAENYFYHLNGELKDETGEKPFTDEQIEKVNALGLTLREFKSLMNMSFSIEDIVGMTQEDVNDILGK
ncbi:MAG: hypothetical protein IKX98_03540 [Clostridia bacterium]|nr:hypothetical protein [Clostridia bacterium]